MDFNNPSCFVISSRNLCFPVIFEFDVLGSHWQSLVLNRFFITYYLSCKTVDEWNTKHKQCLKKKKKITYTYPYPCFVILTPLNLLSVQFPWTPSKSGINEAKQMKTETEIELIKMPGGKIHLPEINVNICWAIELAQCLFHSIHADATDEIPELCENGGHHCMKLKLLVFMYYTNNNTPYYILFYDSWRRTSAFVLPHNVYLFKLFFFPLQNFATFFFFFFGEKTAFFFSWRGWQGAPQPLPSFSSAFEIVTVNAAAPCTSHLMTINHSSTLTFLTSKLLLERPPFCAPLLFSPIFASWIACK